MKWKITVLLLILLGAASFTATALFLSKTSPDTPDTYPIVDPRSTITTVPAANNQFALDYYKKIRGGNSNIVFSPFSVSSALAMTYEGARGATADEMRWVMYYPADANAMRNGYSTLLGKLNTASDNYKLSVANALWLQNDYHVQQEYKDVVQQSYKGNATNLDFKTDAESSRQTINTWVENNTSGKIKDLIAQGTITTDTRLILTNAVYFKGSWTSPFDTHGTSDQEFRTGGGGTVTTSMMQQTDNEFDYMENSTLQMLKMPYEGDALSMLILLPKKDDLAKLEGALTSKNLADWMRSLQQQKVDVYVPKFKFEEEYDMSKDLVAMGMHTAFDAQAADLSGVTGTKDPMANLYISDVVHKAMIEVNEKGTEAAAATYVIEAVGAMVNMTAPSEFRADHPFVFIIQDDATGTILFIGRVSDPTA